MEAKRAKEMAGDTRDSAQHKGAEMADAARDARPRAWQRRIAEITTKTRGQNARPRRAVEAKRGCDAWPKRTDQNMAEMHG